MWVDVNAKLAYDVLTVIPRDSSKHPRSSPIFPEGLSESEYSPASKEESHSGMNNDNGVNMRRSDDEELEKKSSLPSIKLMSK